MTLSRQLTPEGETALQDLARRYNVSVDAARSLLFSVAEGNGTQAQFSHPELGGSGQWMMGGMTMVGDMFNYSLKSTVSGLCSELSSMLQSRSLFVPLPAHAAGGGMMGGNSWWPAELGTPSSIGGQNDARYAYFPQTRRLATLQNGRLSIYDTLDHHISGVQQQQGGAWGSQNFNSQFGTFSVDSLPQVGAEPQSAAQPAPVEPAPPVQYAAPVPPPVYSEAPAPVAPPAAASSQSHDEILSAIERLADLHKKGILEDDEYRSKKADLLSRL